VIEASSILSTHNY